MNRFISHLSNILIVGISLTIFYVFYYVTENQITTAQAFDHDYNILAKIVSFLFTIVWILLFVTFNAIRPGDAFIYGYNFKAKIFSAVISLLFMIMLSLCVALAYDNISFVKGGFLNPSSYVDILKMLLDESIPFTVGIVMLTLAPVFMSFVERGGQGEPQPDDGWLSCLAGAKYAFCMMTGFLFGLPTLFGWIF